ncbi:MAG TPA: M48 family metalloprotease [Steroidobacteraceae bacterium]|nr:M48 family metalloprotease [Steroidobacteraceae bacterium]
MRFISRSLIACAAVAAFAALSGCATNPVTGTPDLVLSSEADEIKRAQQLHPIILQQMGPAYDDPRLQQYVNEVGQRVAKLSHRPDLNYTFTVLDSQDINAFTTGGGYVYVARGLLQYLNSEAELAAVLGHEIGHVTARHAVRQQSQGALTGIGAAAVAIFTGVPDLANVVNMAGTAIVRGYGREMELEADRLGAEYLVRVGFDPESMIDVVRLLKNRELLEIEEARREGRQPRVYHGTFSTHPDNDTRLREVVTAADKLTDGERVSHESERYLRMIEGLPYGPSRAQGVVRDNRFYHGDLGFTMAFPSGWNIENGRDRLTAMSAQKDHALQVWTVAPPPNTGPRELLSRLLAQTGASQGEDLSVNGLQGYTAVARSADTPFGRGPARYAVVYYNNLAYVFAAASRGSSGTPVGDPLFMSTIKTFRRMRQNEYPLAEPDRIKLVRATSGMRVEDLASVSKIDRYAVEQVRLLNDLYPDKQPQAGQLVKIVQ